jgi:hypothetical protein
MIMTQYPANWQNELFKSVQDLVYKVEDAKEHIGKHPKVEEEYKNALKAANEARYAISHFTGVFNQEYRRPE